MATVAELIVLLERGVRRLTAEVVSAREAGKPVESLRGQADAFLLLAYELSEEGDPVALLESMEGMERAAAWTARLDEEKAAAFLAEGEASAGRFHTRSALYSRGLLEGYRQVRGLLGTWSGPPHEGVGE